MLTQHLMNLIRNPERCYCHKSNLFGDYYSPSTKLPAVGGGLQGPAANIEIIWFPLEPVHGAAFEHRRKKERQESFSALSAKMIFEWLPIIWR